MPSSRATSGAGGSTRMPRTRSPRRRALSRDEESGSELASVYAARAWLCGGGRDHNAIEACQDLARTAIELAERSGDDETALDAFVTLGTAELRRDPNSGRATLERAVERGRRQGNDDQVSRALNNIGAFAAARHDHAAANRYLAAALDYCVERDQDLLRINVLAVACPVAPRPGSLDRGDRGGGAVARGSTRLPMAAPRGAAGLGLVRGHEGTRVRTRRSSSRARSASPTRSATRSSTSVWPRPRSHGSTTTRARSRCRRGPFSARRSSATTARPCAGCRTGGGSRIWRHRSFRATEGPYALALTGRWRAAADAWVEARLPLRGGVRARAGG